MLWNGLINSWNFKVTVKYFSDVFILKEKCWLYYAKGNEDKSLKSEYNLKKVKTICMAESFNALNWVALTFYNIWRHQ